MFEVLEYLSGSARLDQLFSGRQFFISALFEVVDQHAVEDGEKVWHKLGTNPVATDPDGTGPKTAIESA